MIIESDDFYFEHHGIKGMRWGVRKKEDVSVKEPSSKQKEDVSGNKQSAVQKDIAAHPKKPLTKKEKANLDEAKKKFEAQREFKPKSDSPKGWRPTNKQLVTIGVGAAAAAAIIGGTIVTKKYLDTGSKPFSVDQYKKFVRKTEPDEWMKKYSGKHMSPNEFQNIAELSTGRIWTGNYITRASFDQKPTTFKPGHQFFRVSNRVEKAFGDATYMVSSKEDLARYQLGWTGATTNVIDFKAKSEIKVPDLHTRLEATREVLRAQGRRHVSPKVVMEHYAAESGGSWDTNIGRAILDNLKAKGYHAIVDDMDAGVYGEMPLVLFDSSRVSAKHTTLSKNVDIKALESILTELKNRR